MNSFGLIETMKVANGRIVFKNLHVERLYQSLKMINIEESIFKLEDRLLRLLQYECIAHGLKNFRLRVEVQKSSIKEYAKDISGLKWNCTIKQTDDIRYRWNENGRSLTLLPKYHKQIDLFSNLKLTERSIYIKAQAYAATIGFDHALVLNENNTIADADIYNVFAIKDDRIYTPSLACAPVAGVFRKLLLEKIPQLQIIEKPISIAEIYQADELFLTNAFRGIQWVNQFDEKYFTPTKTRAVFETVSEFISTHYGEHLVTGVRK